MMNEPRETPLDGETITLLKDWLLTGAAEAKSADTPWLDAQVLNAANDERADLPRQHQFDGLRETAVSFGASNLTSTPKLFGILTESEPASKQVQASCSDTVILMLNVAGNYRIGPNRIYVHMARELARAGCRSLRFDLAGLGDSRHAEGFRATHLYSKDSTPEVRAAIEFFECARLPKILFVRDLLWLFRGVSSSPCRCAGDRSDLDELAPVGMA
jgi:hypothetical protein